MSSDEQPALSERSNEPDDIEDSAPGGKRRIGVVAVVALLVVAADLITKIIAVSTLEGREPVETLGGLVYLQLIRNPYAAFGMPIGATWILAVVAAAVVVAIIWFASRLRSTGWAVGLGLVLAGALGNLIDRIFRAPGPMRGHVVDFISVFQPNGEAWPVFNVADSSICVGAALIVLLSLLGKDYDGKSTKDKAKAGKQSAEPESGDR